MQSNASNITALIIAFIFICNMSIFGLVLTYGTFNDYILYETVGVADVLVSQGTAPNSVGVQVQEIATKFKDTFGYFDILFLSIYALFVGATLYLSYTTDKENYFTVFGTLFFVGLIFLFMISLFVTLSDWWRDEVLVKMLPNILEIMPIYGWYLSHIGILSAIQLIVCIIINLFDFDFAGIINRKKKEQQVLDDEVL